MSEWNEMVRAVQCQADLRQCAGYVRDHAGKSGEPGMWPWGWRDGRKGMEQSGVTSNSTQSS